MNSFSDLMGAPRHQGPKAPRPQSPKILKSLLFELGERDFKKGYHNMILTMLEKTQLRWGVPCAYGARMGAPGDPNV